LPTVAAVETALSSDLSARPWPSVPMAGVRAAKVTSSVTRPGCPDPVVGVEPSPTSWASASAVSRHVRIGSTRS
jgi:hypothetical protein